MGAERKYNSETASLWQENLKRNIWAYERKSNMEDKNNEELDKLIKHENIVNNINPYSANVENMVSS